MASQLRPPSISPSPTIPSTALSTRINATTKEQHECLNRMIMERLALALPPNTSDPRLFGCGLAAFAAIYFAFEGAWQELTSFTNELGLGGMHDLEVRQLLLRLQPPELIRTRRLMNDIEHISSLTRTDVESTVRTQQQCMLDKIRRSIYAKPHLLLAYSWVMYLAIFSGGRYIRHRLAKAGLEFWTKKLDVVDFEKQGIILLEMPGFSFLSFSGERDGEDIRRHFKARFEDADSVLTLQERREVVETAQELFDDCIALVGMLDHITQSRKVWGRISLLLLCMTGVVIILIWKWAELGNML